MSAMPVHEAAFRGDLGPLRESDGAIGMLRLAAVGLVTMCTTRGVYGLSHKPWFLESFVLGLRT